MRLAAQGLAYGYPGKPVGRDIDLSLAGGTVLALLGPNGHGKSTLLKTLLGLLPAQGGAVTLGERPLAGLSLTERARALAYVPQSHAGTFAFSVFEVVLMGRTAHGGLFSAPTAQDRAIAGDMLERFGIAGLAATPYTQISGGERQLVLIARALAQEPRFVILDEPTASLDFGNQGKVMAQIRTLAAAGLGVLFTSHDPNQALRYADEVLLLRDGMAQAHGPAATLLTPERLQALYATTVETVRDAAGRTAFLPG
jgi:iron complex transport system ATP-binding protein